MEISLLGFLISFDIPMGELVFLGVLVLLTVVAYIYMHKSKTKRAVRFGNYETLKEVHGYKSFASPAILVIKVVVIVLIFLVATGSVSIVAEQEVSNTDFVLGLDTSPSMMAPDYDPNRLMYSADQIRSTVDILPQGTRIGLLGYSGSATPVTTLTDDHEEIKEELSMIQPDLGDVGTGIVDAVEMGADMLSESERNRSMIIVTDGEDIGSNEISEIQDISEGEEMDIYILGIDTRDTTEHIYQELEQVMEEEGFESDMEVPELQSGVLEEIAESTGGAYYNIGEITSFREEIGDIMMEEDEVAIDSSYYLLTLIALLVITELIFYSKYGVL